MLEARHYTKGDVVIAEGARESELLLITRAPRASTCGQDGRASDSIASAGTCWGGRAADRAPRSATVLADEESMPRPDRVRLPGAKARHPGAIDLVSNLAREVSSRLRRATRAIRHLAP